MYSVSILAGGTLFLPSIGYSGFLLLSSVFSPGPMEFHLTYYRLELVRRSRGAHCRFLDPSLSVQLPSKALEILATLASLKVCLYLLKTASLQNSVWVPSPCFVAWKLPQGSKLGAILGFPYLFPFSLGITVLCYLIAQCLK